MKLIERNIFATFLEHRVPAPAAIQNKDIQTVFFLQITLLVLSCLGTNRLVGEKIYAGKSTVRANNSLYITLYFRGPVLLYAHGEGPSVLTITAVSYIPLVSNIRRDREGFRICFSVSSSVGTCSRIDIWAYQPAGCTPYKSLEGILQHIS